MEGTSSTSASKRNRSTDSAISETLASRWSVRRTHRVWMPMGFHWLFNFITTRIYAQESDLASGRDILAYQVGRPSLEVELAIQAVT